MLVEGKFKSYEDDLTDIYEIREKVFELELGSVKEKEDKYDQQAMHVVIYVEEKPVAAGRLYFDGDTFQIGKVAVLKEERGNYYGDFVVRMLVDKAFMGGAKEVIADATIDCRDFFIKIGFIEDKDREENRNESYLPLKLVQGFLCKNCNK